MNPKLRRIRAGLASISLENRDRFPRRRSRRIIYSIPLGKSTYKFLRGGTKDSQYFFSLASVGEVKQGTQYIGRFWAKRWLLIRVNNQEARSKVESFSKADVSLSVNFDSSTKLVVQPYAFFGGNLL